MIPAPLLFSILTPLENAVTWLLDRLHYNVGLTWAWAIVGTTILIRIVLVPLTVRQIHSMQALQRHAPAMKELQRKYKGDKQKLNEEMMKFYRENHINPAASCLPMVLQFPIIISLYLVLKHFYRHIPPGSHPNLSWLHFVPNITAPANSHWSGYLLLAVYAASQMSSTYFMSTAMDKLQRRLMMLLPLIFITIIAHFAVGVVLYWVTTNLWTVGQGLVTRRLVPRTAAATPPLIPRRSSRTPPTPSPAGNGSQKAVEAAPDDKQPDTQPEKQPDKQSDKQPDKQPVAAKRPPPSTPRRVKRKHGGARR